VNWQYVLCSELLQPGAVFYMDNFSKGLPVGIPTLATGTFRHCLWTAKGAFIPPFLAGFDRPDVTLDVKHPGGPPTLQSAELKEVLFRAYQGMCESGRYPIT
jgi:hypothetical protein